MAKETLNPNDENLRGQGMHLEGDAHRPLNDTDAVVDVDNIPTDEIELDPTAMEGGVIRETDQPIEDDYGNGDSDV